MGGRYLVFLSRALDDQGSPFYVSGGSLVGRLIVTEDDTLAPVPHGELTPATSSLRGETLDEARARIENA